MNFLLQGIFISRFSCVHWQKLRRIFVRLKKKQMVFWMKSRRLIMKKYDKYKQAEEAIWYDSIPISWTSTKMREVFQNAEKSVR